MSNIFTYFFHTLIYSTKDKNTFLTYIHMQRDHKSQDGQQGVTPPALGLWPASGLLEAVPPVPRAPHLWLAS
jgi:hypothetical protein